MPGLESIAKRLEIIRDIVHQNIREARANTERDKNVNAKLHDFQVGDRVFVSVEMDSSRITNRKHPPAYIGPIVLVELKNHLEKLVHFYTGKPLKNFINVDKLKRLRDELCEVLYTTHRPTQQTLITFQRGSARQCCKGHVSFLWEKPIFDISQKSNPLSNNHKSLHD
jgi:hypothetical protein